MTLTLETGKKAIDKFFSQSQRQLKLNLFDRINYINLIGRHYGIEQLSTENPDLFEKLKLYLESKIADQVPNKKIEEKHLKEEVEQSLESRYSSEIDNSIKILNKTQNLIYSEEVESSFVFNVIDSLQKLSPNNINYLKEVVSNERTCYRDDLIKRIVDTDELELVNAIQLLYNNISSKSVSITESRGIIKESSHELAQPISMLRYDDDIVTTTIKELIDNDKKITLEKIQSNSDTYFNVMLSMGVDKEISDNLELKRFMLAQQLSEFRVNFLSLISKKLPIINANISGYSFVKGEDKVIFNLVLLLSNTNDREWVSGKYKGLDKTK